MSNGTSSRLSTSQKRIQQKSTQTRKYAKKHRGGGTSDPLKGFKELCTNCFKWTNKKELIQGLKNQGATPSQARSKANKTLASSSSTTKRGTWEKGVYIPNKPTEGITQTTPKLSYGGSGIQTDFTGYTTGRQSSDQSLKDIIVGGKAINLGGNKVSYSEDTGCEKTEEGCGKPSVRKIDMVSDSGEDFSKGF